MSGYLAEFIRWFTCWYLVEFIRWLIYLGTCWYLAEFIRWLVHLGTCWGQTMSKASKQQKVQQTKEHTTNKRCPPKSQTLKPPIKKIYLKMSIANICLVPKLWVGPVGHTVVLIDIVISSILHELYILGENVTLLLINSFHTSEGK